MSNLNELIQSVVSAVRIIAPESANNLNPPASEDALSILTKSIPQSPAVLTDFLSLHNGENALSNTSLFPSVLLMDIDSILLCYQNCLDCDDEFIEETVFTGNIGSIKGPVKPVFLYSKRIPFAWLNGGDLVWSLDLDPAAGGQIGQIIEENVECIDIRVIAPSFPSLFKQYLSALAANVFTEEEGQIVSANSWPSRN